jgi:hypothetical protein
MAAPAMDFQIKRAQRAGVKLKIFLAGPSGSGKTKGALWFARAFVGPTGRICVIDTERESASFYAGEPGIGEFDTIALGAPYHTDRYIAAIQATIAEAYDFVIVDSITHQWSGVGGILERKEQMDARGGNNFTNWGKFTPETEKFRNALLEADVNLIATVRSKQEYVIGDEGGGKKSKVQKMGMKPEQREGLEYEFGIGWQLQMDNRAETLKDRTGLFAGQLIDLKDAKVARSLREWVASGAPDVAGEQRRVARVAAQEEIRTAERPAAPPAVRDEATEMAEELARAKALKLAGKDTSWQYPKGTPWGQKPIGDCPTSVLKQAKHFFNDLSRTDPKPWLPDQLEAIGLVLADREKDQGTLEFPGAVDEEPSSAAAAAPIDTTLAPGKIEDALEKPATAAAAIEPQPTGSGLAAVSMRIASLLSNEKLAENDRSVMRAKFESATTLEQLQSVAAEIEQRISLPF